jgi:hypothetical protein
MQGLAKKAESLFVLWVLTLPFHQYSLIGTYSLDNLLAPVLLLSFVFLGCNPNDRYRLGIRRQIAVIFLLLLYSSSHVIPKMGVPELAVTRTTEIAKNVLYFFLPVIFVRRLGVRKKTESAIVVVAVVASVAALMASFGFYEPPSPRFSASRFGLEILPRSVGLFRAFGDMALLLTFSVLVGLFVRRWRLVIKVLITAGLLAGIIASQSRNVMLTLGTGVVVFGVLHKLGVSSKNARIVGLGAVTTVLLVTGIVGVYSSEAITEVLRGWGGEQASVTAQQRLEQYEFAFSKLGKGFLFGIDSGKYVQVQEEVNFVHNMWLREWLQGGVFALLALFGILAIAIANGIALMRVSSHKSRGAAYAAFMVSMFVSTQFNAAGTEIFWVLLGMGVCLALPKGEDSRPMDRSVYR